MYHDLHCIKIYIHALWHALFKFKFKFLLNHSVTNEYIIWSDEWRIHVVFSCLFFFCFLIQFILLYHFVSIFLSFLFLISNKSMMYYVMYKRQEIVSMLHNKWFMAYTYFTACTRIMTCTDAAFIVNDMYVYVYIYIYMCMYMYIYAPNCIVNQDITLHVIKSTLDLGIHAHRCAHTYDVWRYAYATTTTQCNSWR